MFVRSLLTQILFRARQPVLGNIYHIFITGFENILLFSIFFREKAQNREKGFSSERTVLLNSVFQVITEKFQLNEDENRFLFYLLKITLLLQNILCVVHNWRLPAKPGNNGADYSNHLTDTNPERETEGASAPLPAPKMTLWNTLVRFLFAQQNFQGSRTMWQVRPPKVLLEALWLLTEVREGTCINSI